MAAIVVPFRGSAAKRRLAPAPEAVRETLAEAMLRDVLAACAAVGETIVVGDAPVADVPAERVPDPGGGQGPAVAAGLARVAAGPVLVVNADLPCVTARDLLALLGALPPGGMAIVAADDGTTNALALARPHLYSPLYGPGSAARFRAHVPEAATVEIPNLVDDVDTITDLERLRDRLGPHTRAVLDAELEPVL